MPVRLRRVLLSAAAAALCPMLGHASTIFYAPVVSLIGDGSGDTGGTGYTTTIDLFAPGVANQASPVSSSAYASGQLVNVLSNTFEGQLSNNPLVSDEATTGTPYTGANAYVFSGGYAAANQTASVSGTAVAANRVVGTVTVTGSSVGSPSIAASATAASTFNNTNIRAATGSDDLSTIYGAAANNGIRYFTGGVSFSTSSNPTNNRTTQIRNGQLYGSSNGSAAFNGLQMIGTGLPTPSSNASTNVAVNIFLVNAATANASPESFAMFNDTSHSNPQSDGGAVSGFATVPYNVIYVADAGTTTDPAPGIQKWVYTNAARGNGNGGWTLVYTIVNPHVTAGSTVGFQSLTGQLDSNGNTVLYAVDNVSTLGEGNSTANSLVQFTDSLIGSDATAAAATDATEMTLATAGSQTAFRGVALAPISVPEPASLGVIVVGAVGLLARRRRKTI